MIQIAHQTLKAIDEAIEVDQGVSFTTSLLPFTINPPKQRKHLGASQIGKQCARELWYDFNNSSSIIHSSRILRLFNRGIREESIFISLLTLIGCKPHGFQTKMYDLEDNFGGSCDALIAHCPDYSEPLVVEFKTANNSSFNSLAGNNFPSIPFKGKGLRENNFVHYVQLQIYMYKLDIPKGLYFVVNKNTDQLYAEIVDSDPETAIQYIARAKQIIFSDKPPPKINDSSSFFICKMCKHRELCHHLPH